jgi:hypothetical protein
MTKRGEIMMKNKRVIRFLVAFSLLTGLAASPVLAELGLQSILSGEGVVAVGTAVREAVESIYNSTGNPQEIERRLVEILNEAAATGDEAAIRYTIVAVMMAGGPEHLDLSKTAIDNSDVFKNFPEVTAFTVSAAESMLSADRSPSQKKPDEKGQAGGGSTVEVEELGGGEGAMGDDFGGGGGDNPFGDGSDADIDDNDVPGTPV